MIREGWRWAPAVVTRVAGLVMLAIAAGLTHRLFGTAGLGPHRPPGPLDLAAATGAFLGASVGTALVVLGSHLLDRVEVSRRWTRRPDH